MDESLLDISVADYDADFDERPVNRYGSPIAHRSCSDVVETSQAHSSRVVSLICR